MDQGSMFCPLPYLGIFFEKLSGADVGHFTYKSIRLHYHAFRTRNIHCVQGVWALTFLDCNNRSFSLSRNKNINRKTIE